MKEHNEIPPKRSGFLGKWCQNRRNEFVGTSRISISEERIKLLNEIPYWYWEKPDPFMLHYKELKCYLETNHLTHLNANNKILFNWVSQRRIDFKHDKLLQWKITLLNQIHGWYWIQKERTPPV